MSLLHHACRQVRPSIVEKLMVSEWGPALANIATYPSKTPGHWTAMHCLCEAQIPQHFSQQDRDFRIKHMSIICRLVLPEMTEEMLGSRTSTGATIWHMMSSRAHVHLLEVAAEILDFKKDNVKALLNIVNKASGKVRSYEVQLFVLLYVFRFGSTACACAVLLAYVIHTRPPGGYRTKIKPSSCSHPTVCRTHARPGGGNRAI